MKKLVIGLMLMVSIQVVNAADLQLKCNSEMGRFVINIQKLVGSGCQVGDVEFNPRTRYHIELCNGVDAKGVLEVLDITNTWVEVEMFSTAKNCYLWRPISTSNSCRMDRHAHNGRRCQ
jgi:hypothetical protein